MSANNKKEENYERCMYHVQMDTLDQLEYNKTQRGISAECLLNSEMPAGH